LDVEGFVVHLGARNRRNETEFRRQLCEEFLCDLPLFFERYLHAGSFPLLIVDPIWTAFRSLAFGAVAPSRPARLPSPARRFGRGDGGGVLPVVGRGRGGWDRLAAGVPSAGPFGGRGLRFALLRLTGLPRPGRLAGRGPAPSVTSVFFGSRRRRSHPGSDSSLAAQPTEKAGPRFGDDFELGVGLVDS
jgi:hypothetical protein